MNLFDFHDSRIHSGYWWLAKMVYYIRFDEKSQFIRKFLLNEIFSTKSFFWMPIKEIDTTTIYNLHNENGEPDQNAKYIFSGIWILNRPHFMIGNDSLLWYNTYNSIKRSKPSAECCWGYLLLLWLMGSVDKGWLNPSELFPLPPPPSLILLLSSCNVRGLQKDATVYFFYDQHFSAKKCKNENGETCPLWTEIKTWEDMKCTIKKDHMNDMNFLRNVLGFCKKANSILVLLQFGLVCFLLQTLAT